MRHLDMWTWTKLGQGLVRSACYDANRGTLEVFLSNGHLYDYLQVPQDIADELANSDNPDGVFTDKIEPCFDYQIMSQTRGPRL